jgi:hypothetical protein
MYKTPKSCSFLGFMTKYDDVCDDIIWNKSKIVSEILNGSGFNIELPTVYETNLRVLYNCSEYGFISHMTQFSGSQLYTLNVPELDKILCKLLAKAKNAIKIVVENEKHKLKTVIELQRKIAIKNLRI